MYERFLKPLIKQIRKSKSFKTSSPETINVPLTPEIALSFHNDTQPNLSPIQLMPVEILVMICYYSTPQDLYSLCSVCKYFRTILWSKSPKTQVIWERIRILNQRDCHHYLSPPKNMTEQEYIWRTTMANKYHCQFCLLPINMIYYDLYTTNIICCEECIHSRKYGIIKHKYDKYKRLPKKFEESIIPTRHFNLNPNYYKLYWLKDIENFKAKYYSLKKKERKGWLQERRREVKLYLKNIDKYIKQDELRLRSSHCH
ncbi:2867_t:CDS:1 [Funneliformis mosseae]|uniref:2867_t:CDS:1 n=1 Tax=Funneliformis mosseae TaxID=27381 RepID=A0A9N8WNI5_FUNMO|nr:2867_t:CDS:1 [Funneliformis mosseae]